MAKTSAAVEDKKNGQTDTKSETEKKQAQSVEFAEAKQGEAATSSGSIELLLDMNIPVTVAIGQTQIPVRRLLQLGPGSVLRLDKPIDEPVDLYLKDSKFATGEVVVVDGRFAVKVTRILGLGDSADQP